MASHIERRKFLATLGGVAAWPLAARAQQGERMRRVGVLMPLAADDTEGQVRNAAFLQGLQELGWTAAEHPDVILMDLEMPDDDRWEAVRRLKNDPQTRDIPIIGMSAHAVESEREKAIATGCDEFDAKPIEFESLVATIRRVLAPHK
jgi:CheY-like chemotaxis protein